MDIFTSKPLPFESHDNNNNIGIYRDASFSSYLNAKDDNFIRKLSDSTRYLNPNIIISTSNSSSTTTHNPIQILPAAKKNNIIGGVEDGEIGVFGAERYFNGGMDIDTSMMSSTTKLIKSVDENQKQNHIEIEIEIENENDEDGQKLPKQVWVGTPSVNSESISSLNSQRPLLKNFLTINNNNNIPHEKKNVSDSKSSFFPSLGLGNYCKCYSSCKDKNCVDVGEISFSNQTTTTAKLQKLDQLSNSNSKSNIGSFRESHFTFPTTEIERKSLEVFGSPLKSRLRNKSLSLEKRLAMLSWDHSANSNDDEIHSDCSSDLFEIESLTNKANPFLNNANAAAAESCYAPSEASVEWSVVTASAFDFDERRPSTATMTSPGMVITKVNSVNKAEVVQKRRSSSILGCNSQKAVKVAEEAYKTMTRTNNNSDVSNTRGRRKSESSAGRVIVKRFEDETKVGGFSFRSQGHPTPHRALATLSLPRPYSPRLSNISFNIQ